MELLQWLKKKFTEVFAQPQPTGPSELLIFFQKLDEVGVKSTEHKGDGVSFTFIARYNNEVKVVLSRYRGYWIELNVWNSTINAYLYQFGLAEQIPEDALVHFMLKFDLPKVLEEHQAAMEKLRELNQQNIADSMKRILGE